MFITMDSFASYLISPYSWNESSLIIKPPASNLFQYALKIFEKNSIGIRIFYALGQ
jgi:hypothetical protein